MQTTEKQAQNELLKKHGYRWRRIDGEWKLFNVRNERTPLAQALHEIATYTVPQPIVCLDDRPAAQAWARAVLATNPVILDTETTGLDATSEVVEIAVIETGGNVLLNTLVKPVHPCSVDALATHGITDEMLEDAPFFDEVWNELYPILLERDVVVYNARYDIGVLRHCAGLRGLTFPDVKAHCLMKQYAAYAGVVKVDCGCYAYHKLDAACANVGIAVHDVHRALIDARSANALLCAMARR